MASDEPITMWQERDGVRSGGGFQVRAASFAVGSSRRGAVMLTVRVSDGFWMAVDGGGMTATLLLDPNEARGVAAWLDQGADAADAVGPPLYGDS